MTLRTLSVKALIENARRSPPVPVIEDLLYEHDIFLVHGEEASFKSVFVFQMAEALTLGTPFLRRWVVPTRRRVGIIETELHEAQLGKRLGSMFPGTTPPGLRVFGDMSGLRRELDLKNKLAIAAEWIQQEKLDVLLID